MICAEYLPVFFQDVLVNPAKKILPGQRLYPGGITLPLCGSISKVFHSKGCGRDARVDTQQAHDGRHVKLDGPFT